MGEDDLKAITFPESAPMRGGAGNERGDVTNDPSRILYDRHGLVQAEEGHEEFESVGR